MLWNSKVLTPDGYKQICRLKPGQYVLLYNLKTNRLFAAKLKEVKKYPRRPPIRIRCENRFVDLLRKEKIFIKRESLNGSIRTIFAYVYQLWKSNLFGSYDFRKETLTFKKITNIILDPAKMRHYWLDIRPSDIQDVKNVVFVVNSFLVGYSKDT